MSKYYNRLRKFEFTDILGWSYSRYNTFQQCKRKYYYEYYRKRDIENVGKIAALKDLTSVPLEIGNISHKLIQALLNRLQKTADEIDREKFYDYARRTTHDICAEKNFEDIYYGKRDHIDLDIEIFQPVMVAMRNFLESERLQWLFEEALVAKDDWIIEFEDNNKYGECRIDNHKAYCKVDFLFPVDDRLHIIDWKTGKEDYAKHSVQLRGYAGWANCQFGTDLSNITTTVAHLLPEYKETSVVLTEYDIDDFAMRVREQTDAMHEYCEVPELNIPFPKEKFEMTPLVNFCKTCKYRELCDRK
ncbi:MAG: PD-(D/E)XK nuclease family protein [Pyrinomonadaceae bacterium]